MTVRHTPGPWRALHSTVSAEWIVMTRHEEAVAWIDRTTPMAQQQEEANARLIAAAPDLYEALVGLFGADFSEDLRSHWDKARIALAKAEGAS